MTPSSSIDSRPRKLVAAALFQVEGRVLMARRPEGVHLAGLWEFPGGKIESGESPEQCLVREIQEELGVTCQVGPIFTVVFHPYPEFDLLMLVYSCTLGIGEPRPIACAELRWVDLGGIRELPLPPADEPVVDALLKMEGDGSD